VKVLVVGASGYLGYWVARLLHERGADVLALSRRGTSHHGQALAGDVTRAGLGLDPETIAGTLSDVDAVISCFGSVDWDMPAGDLVGLHVTGTRNVLDLAATLPRASRVVHVSSVLALGRAQGPVGNRTLAVGQTFRNWYEYAKYRAEAIARLERRTQVTAVRLGALLGPAPEELVPLTGGPIQALPHLLQGMPLFLEKGGRYPVYAGDVAAAAAVVVQLACASDPPGVCTYFDPRLPTLAELLHELCRPWNCVPRLVEGARGTRWLQRVAGQRIGLTEATLSYDSPLPSLDPAELSALPPPVPAERPGYVAETASLLYRARRPLLRLSAG
jgi:nucleoside-diphosphate-sugar epimerase